MGVCGLRTSYSIKQYVILAFLIGDLALNTMIDSQSEKVSVLTEMIVQAILRIMSLFVMLLFMWDTFVFRYGLLGVLCRRFKLLFIIFPISFVFLVAVRIMRGVTHTNTHTQGTAGEERDRWEERVTVRACRACDLVGRTILTACSCLSVRCRRLVCQSQVFNDDDTITIWASNNYHGLYIVHNLFSIAYYVALLQSTFDLGNPAFYKASAWINNN